MCPEFSLEARLLVSKLGTVATRFLELLDAFHHFCAHLWRELVDQFVKLLDALGFKRFHVRQHG